MGECSRRHMATQPFPIDQAAATNKAEQNRINAQSSTGPKTEAGKKRSSLNALKHGLTGHTVVMPHESLQAFKEFSAAICDIHNPIGAYETTLAQKAADTQWRMNRAGAVEANLFSLGHERNAGRFTVDDNDHATTDIQAGFAIAFTFREETNTLLNIALYEQRLLRIYKSTIEDLKQAQAARFAKLKEEESELEIVRNLHKARDREFHPKEFGFVSAPQLIETHFRRKDALKYGILPEICSRE